VRSPATLILRRRESAVSKDRGCRPALFDALLLRDAAFGCSSA
jgi:hypothetical protein